MMVLADYWQLEFHPAKSVIMSIDCKEGSAGTYRMNEVDLKQGQLKDIRVATDHQLKF